MADWQATQGDTAIVLKDTLTYSDGSTVDLTGGSVKCVLRARSANAPSTNATATITHNTAPATVTYQLTSDDTALAGLYQQEWVVTFSGGTVEHFPTVGYNTLEVRENLSTANQTIVELSDLKDYLNLPSNDRSHDGELLRFLAATTPVIEFIVGPVLPRVYQNELYDGGVSFISVRHRPIIEVHEVIEYRGPIAWLLTQVASADQGSIYSYEWEPSGRITRRNVGGGTQTFPGGIETIRVSYTAGQVKTPENIRMAALELVRVNYQQTQQAGGGRIGVGSTLIDEGTPTTQMMGFVVPGRVRELLAPNKRHPAIA